MKIRVVIGEVIVDAECTDTLTPAEGAKGLLKVCVEEAIKLHQAKKDKKP